MVCLKTILQPKCPKYIVRRILFNIFHTSSLQIIRDCQIFFNFSYVTSLFPCNKENISSWTDMPHKKIAFVVPFVMLHSPNCALLFIHPDLWSMSWFMFFRLYYFVLPFHGEIKMYIYIFFFYFFYFFCIASSDDTPSEAYWTRYRYRCILRD